MKAKEIRDLSNEEMARRIGERQNDLVVFRMQLATGVVENNRVARVARRDIARMKTILRERELSAMKGTQ